MRRFFHGAKNRGAEPLPPPDGAERPGRGAPPPCPGANDRKWILPVCVLLAAAVLLVFGQTLRHEFVNFDDDEYVYQNPQVRAGLTFPGLVWAFTRSHSSNWHPLTWLSHMLDCQIYGLNAAGHHLTNILLHAATAILLFLVLRQMTGALWPSAFVAVIFAIHPLHVQSVAWISERKDVLSGLFFTLTLGAYARYVRQPASFRRYAAVMLFFALGLMSKPMLVTLPFVLLLLDYWPLGRVSGFGFRASVLDVQTRDSGSGPNPKLQTRNAKLLWEKVPLFMLSAASSAVTLLVQHSSGTLPSLDQVALPARLLNGLVSYGAYIVQMFWPAGLAVFYPYPAEVAAWQVLGAGVLMLSATALAVAIARRFPWFLVGWLWYVGMLVPVIGLVQVGLQSRADRYTYLPQIGLYLLVAWTAKDFLASRKYSRQLLIIVLPVVIAALTICSWKQTEYWRNSELLWNRALACAPDNPVPHVNLGNALVAQGRYPEAVAHFERALQLNPNHAIAHNDLANALVGQGRFAEAMEHYRKAVELKPDYADAHCNLANLLFAQGRLDEAIAHYRKTLQLNPRHPEACKNLGNAFMKRGRVAEAIEYYQKAIQFGPDDAGTHYNLGLALAAQGRLDESSRQYQQAIQLNPTDSDAPARLADVFAAQGRFAEALGFYRKALELDPRHGRACLGLAWLLATCPEASLRDGARAIELARRVELSGGANQPQVLDALAAAYAEAGRFPEAVETARRAAQLAARQSNAPAAEALRQRLELYQSNSPFRTPWPAPSTAGRQ